MQPKDLNIEQNQIISDLHYLWQLMVEYGWVAHIRNRN